MSTGRGQGHPHVGSYCLRFMAIGLGGAISGAWPVQCVCFPTSRVSYHTAPLSLLHASFPLLTLYRALTEPIDNRGVINHKSMVPEHSPRHPQPSFTPAGLSACLPVATEEASMENEAPCSSASTPPILALAIVTLHRFCGSCTRRSGGSSF